AVGTRLRVRPHITENGDIDLLVNLELSDIAPGQSVFGNQTFNRRETTTHVVLKNGQTVMLSGIINQTESNDNYKLPILGDVPVLGSTLFGSKAKVKSNRELLAFITP